MISVFKTQLYLQYLSFLPGNHLLTEGFFFFLCFFLSLFFFLSFHHEVILKYSTRAKSYVFLQHPKTRLRGSFRLWEGRVEVKSKDVKEILHWGTVCDDRFDMVDANVVCRSLGLGSASRVFTNAKFGQGVQSVSIILKNCSFYIIMCVT